MARSAIPTRGRENRISLEVRMSLGERARRSHAPTKEFRGSGFGWHGGKGIPMTVMTRGWVEKRCTSL